MAKTLKPKLNELTRRLKSIKAKDIMTKDVITTTEDTLLSDIAQIMIKSRISGLPVVRKKKVVGIITASDLFIVMDMIKSGDVVENHKTGAANPTVKFAMSTEVNKIKKSTSLDEIIILMKYRNAHTLPVVEESKLVGVIGRRDVFKNFYAVMKDLYL
ncbi:MAG: CBS domain-containing protein [Candidatus Omnitrophota bacterium]|nr:MAG: CBS domain-containing protein [Candidatus Omnitrophota bacterium]